MKYVRFFFCRHTETDFNVEDRYAGRLDPPLNATGIEQAEALATTLADQNLIALYSSDQLRARQTAVGVAQPHNLVPVIDDRLAEVACGEMDGMLKKEARLKFKGERFSRSGNVYDFTSIGGERRKEVISRELQLFYEIVHQHGTKKEAMPNIGVIGHRAALRSVFAVLHVPYAIKQGDYQVVEFSEMEKPKN